MNNNNIKIKTLKKMDYTLIDLFAIPISIFSTRRTPNTRFGSLPGTVLSLIFVSFIITYITFTLNSMMLGEKDKHSAEIIANTFED